MLSEDTVKINDYPKNGRLDNYLKEWECTKITEKQKVNIPKLEQFMFKIFKDCMAHLKEQYNLSFPQNMQLTFIYKKEEYEELLRELDRRFGARPYTRATCVVGENISYIYLYVPSYYKRKRIDFLTNLSMSLLEELIHSAYSAKRETDIQNLCCSAVEGFLEVKLPDAAKDQRLKYARNVGER